MKKTLSLLLIIASISLFSCSSKKENEKMQKINDCTVQYFNNLEPISDIIDRQIEKFGVSDIDSIETTVIYPVKKGENESKSEKKKYYYFVLGVKFKNIPKTFTAKFSYNTKEYIQMDHEYIKNLPVDNLIFEVSSDDIITIYKRENWIGKKFIERKVIRYIEREVKPVLVKKLQKK